MPSSFNILAGACLTLSLMPLNANLAEQDLIDEDPIDKDLMEGGQQCLRTRSIKRTEVIHDQAILFYMRGATIYVNVLPKPCKNLSTGGRFMYESSVARLCRSDHIKVLQDAGFGLTSGRACRIGGFHPISREQVEALKEPQTVDPQPIPPANPEQPSVSDPAEQTDEATEPAARLGHF